VVQPENSKNLTGLIISWIARTINTNLILWDFRHDCRKAKSPVEKGKKYKACYGVDILMTEAAQLQYLSQVLVWQID